MIYIMLNYFYHQIKDGSLIDDVTTQFSTMSTKVNLFIYCYLKNNYYFKYLNNFIFIFSYLYKLNLYFFLIQVSDLSRKEWQNITGSNIPAPPKSHSTNFVPLSTENSSLISDGSSGNQKYKYDFFFFIT